MQISKTAAFIAIKIYGLSRYPKIAKAFPEAILNFYESMVCSLPAPLKWYHKLLKSRLIRRFFIFSEELLLSGDLMHIVGRKYFIHQRIESLLDEGFEQLVILGAGFDHNGVYYSDKNIRCFEIDFPEMIHTKKQFVEDHQLRNKDLHFLGADLSKDRLMELLNNYPEFDANVPTLFLAEGFFDYMSLLPSEHLLEDIKALNSENRLISTFFSLNELNVFHRWVFRTGVSMVGEELKFKITVNDFIDLLDELGFDYEWKRSTKKMQKELQEITGLKLPVMKGFYVLDFRIP